MYLYVLYVYAPYIWRIRCEITWCDTVPAGPLDSSLCVFYNTTRYSIVFLHRSNIFKSFIISCGDGDSRSSSSVVVVVVVLAMVVVARQRYL